MKKSFTVEKKNRKWLNQTAQTTFTVHALDIEWYAHCICTKKTNKQTVYNSYNGLHYYAQTHIASFAAAAAARVEIKQIH